MKILLIEDDLDDIELLQDALATRHVAFTMEAIRDGAEAISFIRNSQECPDLIILDLNLPKVHGREIILQINSMELFKSTPLLILTTSSAQEDIRYAYANGADKYLLKPTDLQMINEMVDTIVALVKR